MHIEEVILEGFKSYATRTIIKNWDPEFNAITGLNGSGKSNILDAICFVLGIENLRQVRATNLQDLVYKRGQTGITKASVTIVFNNSNSSSSPFGYQDQNQISITRQVIVGGMGSNSGSNNSAIKNKYMINGHVVQQKALENLFQSVQLNINNPHFLIMQGQITKVLNMKPPEFLSMLEEAAGTRMFEERREKALGTMEKKEYKIKEMEQILAEVIEPKMINLQSEKRDLIQFRRIESDLEEMKKYTLALEYTNKTNQLKELEISFEELQSSHKETLEEENRIKSELLEIHEKLKEFQNQKIDQSNKNHKYHQLEKELKDSEHELIKLQTTNSLKKQTFEEENQAIKTLASKISSEQVVLEDSLNHLNQIQTKNLVLKDNFDHLSKTINQDEELLRSLTTGLSSGSSSSTGYTKLANDLEDEHSQIIVKIENYRLKSDQIKREIENLESILLQSHKENSNSNNTINLLKLSIQKEQDELAKLNAQLKSCQFLISSFSLETNNYSNNHNRDANSNHNDNHSYNDNHSSHDKNTNSNLYENTNSNLYDHDKNEYRKKKILLLQKEKTLSRQLFDLEKRMESLKSSVSHVTFSYTLPEPNWNGDAVKGSIIELIDIVDGENTNENGNENQSINEHGNKSNNEHGNGNTSKYENENKSGNMKMKLPLHLYALEIIAGNRLYNVVVEDDQIATKLLEKGKLQKRTTMIPLNKIQFNPISKEKFNLALEITNEKAIPALSLLSYDSSVKRAIEYVFGHALVCKDREAAKKCAFDKRIQIKSVTIDGDVYEPSGTLSGGSGINIKNENQDIRNRTVLERLVEYRLISKEIINLNSELKIIKNQLASFDEYFMTIDEILSKEQQLQILKRQLSQNAIERTTVSIEELKREYKEIQNELIPKEQSKIIKLKKEIDNIRGEMTELGTDRQGKLSQIEKRIKLERIKLGKEQVNLEKSLKELEIHSTDCNVKRGQLEKMILDRESREILVNSTIKIELDQLRLQVAQAQTKYTGLVVQFESEMKNIKSFNNEIMKLEEDQRFLQESLDQSNLIIQKLLNNLKKVEGEIRNHSEWIKNTTSINKWINESKGLFGVANGPFDFVKGTTLIDGQERMSKLQEEYSNIRKNINFHVMDMIEKLESREASLRQMMNTIKKDKSKIEQTITTLDKYKLEALYETWNAVNRDFGQIFSELIPGNNSCILEPLKRESGMEMDLEVDLEWKERETKGKRELKMKNEKMKNKTDPSIKEHEHEFEGIQGMTVKVSLGGIWKNSLSELSGGQRSVVALSLILSLLQFKPAPMYLLDEIDAALDLSHTQNIGHLLKTRFKGSQFILVSLKEDMYQNANVVFKVKYRDGISLVERLDNREGKDGNGNGNDTNKSIDNDKKMQRKKGIVRVNA